MPSLFDQLKNRIKCRTAIVGVGNTLRNDDGAGPALVKLLKQNIIKKGMSDILDESTFIHKPSKTALSLIDAGEVPENFVGHLDRFGAETIMIVDTADMKSHPGFMDIIEMNELDDTGFSTHNVSLKVFMEYFTINTWADVFMLGIQPKSVGLGENISQGVESSLREFVSLFDKVLESRVENG